jgi:LacI family transcriptional regulator
MTRKSVALLVETSNAYARGLVEGITDYLREFPGWSIYLPEQQRSAEAPRWLTNWHGDGVIARIETAHIAAALSKLKIPVIDVSAARPLPDLPWVETDDEAIARLAAEHLLQRGFRNLAYCGEIGFNWSRWRGETFTREVLNRGAKCYQFENATRGQQGYRWQEQMDRLSHWLCQLPKPIGIMACYDMKAQQLLDTCRQLGIAVPDEVAVIGVDNDELLCNLCDPPLSSVIPDARRTGYLAAELLQQAMEGKKVPAEGHFIEPLGVATRQSTDVLAIEDREIAAVVRYIRLHACSGITVKDILRDIPMSRRVLENRFIKWVGKTPHEAILQQRLDRVKVLLRETELPLDKIAIQTGFEHPEYLSVVFRKHFGMPPGAYRRISLS